MRVLRGNSTVRLVRRAPKADPWQVYDRLPAPIRALQEGPVELDPRWALSSLRHFRRLREDEPSAIWWVVKNIGWAHHRTITMAAPWQPPGHGRRKPLPSPHILAGATMQTSRRTAA
jgi:hypothetical protein